MVWHYRQRIDAILLSTLKSLMANLSFLQERLTLIIFALHSKSGVYNFKKKEVMSSYLILGDFSPSEIKRVEMKVAILPKRLKPYVFVRKWGKIWWKVNE